MNCSRSAAASAVAVLAVLITLVAGLAAPAAAATRTGQPPGLTPAQLAQLEREQGPNGSRMGQGQSEREGPTVLTPQASSTWQPPGVQGVDVSNWDGYIDWPEVAAMGARFAYVKASEGTNYTSPTWGQQYPGAAAVGLVRGSYHFALPPVSDAATQARFFVANGGNWTPDGRTLPPMLDIEFNKYPSLGNTCYNMSPEALTAWITEFVTTMQALIGRKPTIYTNTMWWNTCVGSASFGSYPLHIARYSPVGPTMPPGWSYYRFWQYSESGPFVGDSNVFNGTLAELHAFALRPTAELPSSPLAAGVIPAVTSPNGGVYAWPTGAPGWVNLGGRVTTPPAVVHDGTRLHIVAMGVNNRLYHRTLDTGWAPLAPEGFWCTHLGAGLSAATITVGCRGGNGALYSLSFPAASDYPYTTSYRNLGGRIVGAPAVISPDTGLLPAMPSATTFLVTGGSYADPAGTSTTYARTETTGWVRAAALLGVCAEGPAAAVRDQQVYAVCAGTTGGMQVYWRDAATSGRYTTDGVVLGTPAVTVTTAGATLVVEGGNQGVYSRPLPKTTAHQAGGWTANGGVVTGGVAATARP